MARFLIEVQHDADVASCARVVEVFLKSGSHFLTNAEWGCLDGQHKAWLIVDVENREEARCILPLPFRAGATIIALNRFSLDEIGTIFRHHGLE